MPSAECSGVFPSASRVEECSTWQLQVKHSTQRSSLSLFSQLTNHSGGGAGLIRTNSHVLLVLRLNNNGVQFLSNFFLELYIACLWVFTVCLYYIELPDYHNIKYGISPVPPPLWLVSWLKSDSDERCILPEVEHSSTPSAEKKTPERSALSTKKTLSTLLAF